jgi:hypothetical protein
MSAFVGILESSPAANVIDQDDVVVGLTAFHVLQQLLERLAMFDRNSATRPIDIAAHDT